MFQPVTVLNALKHGNAAMVPVDPLGAGLLLDPITGRIGIEVHTAAAGVSVDPDRNGPGCCVVNGLHYFATMLAASA